MILGTPRLRMFAGPNGSGKSTFKSMIRKELLGIYVNPDDIEKEITDFDFLDLAAYSVSTNKEEILSFFKKSSLLERADCLEDAHSLRFNDDKLIFHEAGVNAYYASVAADFIRQKLMQSSKSFTFETVMSFPDKIELLQKAQSRGYRTYLYYVATEIKNNVEKGTSSSCFILCFRSRMSVDGACCKTWFSLKTSGYKVYLVQFFVLKGLLILVDSSDLRKKWGKCA